MAPVASRLADERPDEVALRDDRVALGWAEVSEALNRVANGLRGARPGPASERAAVLAENSAETVLAHLGGLLAGISTVPTNFHLNAEEVAYILEDSGTASLFVGPETVETGLAAAHAGRGAPSVVGWRCPTLEGLTAVGAAGWPRPTPASRRPTWRRVPTSCTRRARRAGPRASSCRPRCSPAARPSPSTSTRWRGNALRPLFGTHLVVGPMYHTGPLSGVRLLAARLPVVVLGRFDAEARPGAIDDVPAPRPA